MWKIDRKLFCLLIPFNSCFEAENANAALEVLTAAGYKVTCPNPVDNARPLCCGRTFLVMVC